MLQSTQGVRSTNAIALCSFTQVQDAAEWQVVGMMCIKLIAMQRVIMDCRGGHGVSHVISGNWFILFWLAYLASSALKLSQDTAYERMLPEKPILRLESRPHSSFECSRTRSLSLVGFN